MHDLVRDDGTAVAKYGERALHEFMYEIAMRALAEAEAAGHRQHDFLYSAMRAKRWWLDGQFSTEDLRPYQGLVADATYPMENQCFLIVAFACGVCDGSPSATEWHPLARAAHFSAAHYEGNTWDFMSFVCRMFYHRKDGKGKEVWNLFNDTIEKHRRQEASYWSEIME